ncbi:MAG: tetratricopeptide repeat protein, partial [Candidatus Dadabacteria bacterium]|nr:tetratricopeptide repeat protein [Candidatus Dadabacteria bacterium]
YGEAYVTRGLARIVLGDYGSAIQDSTIAIELDPSYAEAYVTRGLARRNLADYRGAIRDLDRAIETNSDLFQKHYNSGFARSEIGDYAGAIHDFNRAIELYPKYADMYFIRGITDIALQSFYDVIEVKPGYFFTFHDRDYREHTSSYSLAYFSRGLAKSYIHDYRGAVEDYNYSILLNPDIPVVYHKRGIAKSSIGDHGSAVRDFNKAIQINTVRQSAAAAGFPYSELLHP